MQTVTLSDVEAEIAAIKNELSDLARQGARPLWSSFTSRLDQMAENLGGTAPVDGRDQFSMLEAMGGYQ